MNKIKKLLVVFLAVAACFSLAIGLTACQGDPEKVTIKLAGLTPAESGEYSTDLNEGASQQYTLIVGSLTDYEFETASSNAAVATASATQNALSVQGVKAGTAKITLSEKSGKANDLILNVTVKEVPAVAPTAAIFSFEEGSGTLADPYTVELAEGGNTATSNIIVQPTGANSAFTWTVGTVENEAFVAGEGCVTASQNGVVLTITSGDLADDKDADTLYIKGAAQTGDLTVYIKVTVNKYVKLESIAVNGLTEAEASDDFDYVLKTAKGTNWNLDKVAGRLTNGMGKSEQERPDADKVSYYHSVTKFSCAPTPADATDTDWIITEEGNANIFKANPDGTWEVTGTGETIIKITNGKGEASVKIKLVVEDTVYTGILKSVYDEVTAETNLDWSYDDHADDTVTTARSLLNKWYFAMNKTTSDPDGDDGNQKIFWLGSATRPYGFDLETHLDTKTGTKGSDTLALAWTKATIPAGADKIEAIFGSHSSDSYTFGRIVLVKEDGTVYNVSGDWDVFGGKSVSFDIPSECLGATVAVVVEVRLSNPTGNSEFQCKGIWVNTPIKGITFDEDTVEVPQASTNEIEYNTVPTKVVDGSVTYAVTKTPAGGDGKITIDNKGNYTVAMDAPTGEYEITVTSAVDDTVKAVLKVNVIAYINLTSFSGTYVGKRGVENLNGANINVKQGANAYELAFVYAPDDASVKTYTVTYKDGDATEATEASSIVKVEDDKLYFVAPGRVEVIITPDAEEAAAQAIAFNVTVQSANIIVWEGADEIFDAETGWTKVADEWYDSFGEGAGLRSEGGYISYEADLTERNTLTVGARTFARPDDPNAKLYVSVITSDSTETFLKAKGYNYGEDDYILIDTAEPSWDTRNNLVYDLSAFVGQTVTIKILNGERGAYCCITDVKLSNENTVLNWGEANQASKDAIVGEGKWTAHNWRSGVGEGADPEKDGYIENTVDVTSMDTLLVYIRLFNGQQGGEHADVEMEVTINGEVIKPIDSDTNATLEECAENETAQPFYYDLSEYTGEVTIRLTNVSPYHCVIQQITIS